MWVLFNEDGSPRWIGPDQMVDAEWVEGVDEKTLLACRRVDGKWIMRDPVKVPEPTPEEIAAEAEAEKRAADAAKKMTGVEFEGILCSATRDDQDGLTAVFLLIQMQGAAFKGTKFEFANGSSLVITLSNYAAFTAVWVAFRQSFFRPV